MPRRRSLLDELEEEEVQAELQKLALEVEAEDEDDVDLEIDEEAIFGRDSPDGDEEDEDDFDELNNSADELVDLLDDEELVQYQWSDENDDDDDANEDDDDDEEEAPDDDDMGYEPAAPDDDYGYEDQGPSETPPSSTPPPPQQQQHQSELRGYARSSYRRTGLTETDAPPTRDRLALETRQRRTTVSSMGDNAAKPSRLTSRFSLMTGKHQNRNVSFMAGGHTPKRETSFLHKSMKFLRRSTRATSGTDDSPATFEMNLDSLKAQDGNSVAAAAAVVAAGVVGSPQAVKRGHTQFAVGDYVLVLITLLNLTNRTDDEDCFTVAPVNKFGYPAGEGKTEEERNRDYNYVVARVKTVHFDEDWRYYTVIRCDTGSEQRAEADWMEPLKDQAGIDAAMRAASRTTKSIRENVEEEEEMDGFCSQMMSCIMFVLACPARFVQMTLLPGYGKVRLWAKEQVSKMLQGQQPYGCRLRITGINFLVLCSLIYLFLEVVSLAYFPASWDYGVACVGVSVWCILALELIFELLIRPPNYEILIESDKAYCPSTARHINRYHLVTEGIALLLFIPNFHCLVGQDCGRREFFGGLDAALDAVVGGDRWHAAVGRFALGLTSLRIFGLVRHWKQMWINNAYKDEAVEHSVVHRFFMTEAEHENSASERSLVKSVSQIAKKKKTDEDHDGEGGMSADQGAKSSSSEDEQRLKKAATIGTALMLVNSHRAMFLFATILTILPVIQSLHGQNLAAGNLVDLLQGSNVASMGSAEECLYIDSATSAWLDAVEGIHKAAPRAEASVFVLWAQVLPPRCSFNATDGVITTCPDDVATDSEVCDVWSRAPADPADATPKYFGDELGIRIGGISYFESSTTIDSELYSVKVLFNENHTVSLTNSTLFVLLLGTLFLLLFGLTVLRADARRLVLDPLQRMLKIVVRYAENPLQSPTNKQRKPRKKGPNSGEEDEHRALMQNEDDKKELGNYETEQLINAISKIADLLRKCWGVAGAGIISSNLARTKDGKTVVFNPTVPGKRVYALFGFVAINGFDKQLRCLDRDVMILINDVAKVVHDEVYRWALGDSGQCNKNLGSAFLMVFRIGDFSEVHAKKKRATDVVFRDTQNAKKTTVKAAQLRRRANRAASQRRRNFLLHQGGGRDDTLQLASLPGIQSFTDRALLGMLKSFAGIHRDRNLMRWQRDLRLSGSQESCVSVIYGMDAGWAVEGAVGSEYKIDATYLSPHVNMASRMMSATRQYGVTILLSQAVEELLSKPAQSKLRHLDTVLVKGSNIPQRIYTFDARHEGVDFFLIERTPEQADLEAESYNVHVWDNDQDLKGMQQHISEEFMGIFKRGVDQYLEGRWKEAIQTLQSAEDIMIESVLEEGYIDYDPDEIQGNILDRRNTGEEITRIRNKLGDGPCRCLLEYMERRKGVPPSDWKGVRKLLSK